MNINKSTFHQQVEAQFFILHNYQYTVVFHICFTKEILEALFEGCFLYTCISPVGYVYVLITDYMNLYVLMTCL